MEEGNSQDKNIERETDQGESGIELEGQSYEESLNPTKEIANITVEETIESRNEEENVIKNKEKQSISDSWMGNCTFSDVDVGLPSGTSTGNEAKLRELKEKSKPENKPVDKMDMLIQMMCERFDKNENKLDKNEEKFDRKLDLIAENMNKELERNVKEIKESVDEIKMQNIKLEKNLNQKSDTVIEQIDLKRVEELQTNKTQINQDLENYKLDINQTIKDQQAFISIAEVNSELSVVEKQIEESRVQNSEKIEKYGVDCNEMPLNNSKKCPTFADDRRDSPTDSLVELKGYQESRNLTMENYDREVIKDGKYVDLKLSKEVVTRVLLKQGPHGIQCILTRKEISQDRKRRNRSKLKYSKVERLTRIRFQEKRKRFQNKSTHGQIQYQKTTPERNYDVDKERWMNIQYQPRKRRRKWKSN